jgi:hypothetical protein
LKRCPRKPAIAVWRDTMTDTKCGKVPTERRVEPRSFDAHLTVRIDEDCLQRLDRWARREGVTATTLARTILEEAIQQENATAGKTSE